jgi:hypothetical protein
VVAPNKCFHRDSQKRKHDLLFIAPYQGDRSNFCFGGQDQLKVLYVAQLEARVFTLPPYTTLVVSRTVEVS